MSAKTNGRDSYRAPSMEYRMLENLYLIPCEIRRGGFSTERLFTIETAGGTDTFAGHFEHFVDCKRKPIDISAPSPGQSIHGFAMCRVIQIVDDGVIVDIPSSDAVLVSGDDLVPAQH